MGDIVVLPSCIRQRQACKLLGYRRNFGLRFRDVYKATFRRFFLVVSVAALSA